MNRTFFILILLLIFCIEGFSQNAGKHQNLDKGIALQGYDPVAYFTLNKALKGSSGINVRYNGAIFYFTSEANKVLFLKDPVKYEARYGGWCAYAMGNTGEKVEVDPETFKIIDSHLYLYYNAFFNNTLKSWNENETSLKHKADANWAKIIKK